MMNVIKYIKRILLFLVPVYLYCLFIVIIDPYEFINLFHAVSAEKKIATLNRSEEASPRGNILWKYIHFKRNPKPYVVFGDSQGRRMSVDLIRKYSGKEYFNFCVPGASFPTIVENFWYTAESIPLKEVYF